MVVIYILFLGYHVGSELGWSPEFWFKTIPKGESWSPQLAVYGDMGNINAKSLAHLQEETQRGMYNAILHVGDFAYDMNWVSFETSKAVVEPHRIKFCDNLTIDASFIC